VPKKAARSAFLAAAGPPVEFARTQPAHFAFRDWDTTKPSRRSCTIWPHCLEDTAPKRHLHRVRQPPPSRTGPETCQPPHAAVAAPRLSRATHPTTTAIANISTVPQARRLIPHPVPNLTHPNDLILSELQSGCHPERSAAINLPSGERPSSARSRRTPRSRMHRSTLRSRREGESVAQRPTKITAVHQPLAARGLGAQHQPLLPCIA
jgi:hypothetical protein